MNKMKTLSVLFTALTLSVSAWAGTSLPLVETESQFAVVTSKEKVKLFYKGSEISNVSINLYNQKGDKLISYTVRKTDGFILPFGFENLEKGTYTIELTDNSGTRIETFDYNYEVASTLKSSIYKVKGGDKYSLQVVNEGVKPAEVYVYDNDRQLLHKFSSEFSFTRILDLSEIKGNVMIKVTNGEFSSYHNLNN